MDGKAIFVANLNDVLGKKTSVSALVEEFKSRGESIDYSYVMNVKKGSTNPSLEKSQQIVSMLKLLPNYSWVEYWMFFVPDYFKRFNRDALAEREISSQFLDSYINELLTTAHRFQIVKLDQKQFDQITELAKYIRQKSDVKAGAESNNGEQKFLA